MGFEVDFLPVGKGATSGDAIALRFGDLLTGGSQQVVTIDGGTLVSGEKLCRHIETHYGTNTVDVAVLTHPDQDHASGMRVILEMMDVRAVVMHRPWLYSDYVKHIADDKRVTVDSIAARIEGQFIAAKEVEELAIDKVGEKNIFQPFALPHSSGPLKCLGPTEEFYLKQLPYFRSLPDAKSTSSTALSTKLTDYEDVRIETLIDPPENATSFENNSSTIILFEFDGHKILFTGDAGVSAITAALDFADFTGISLQGSNLFQIPHHGSRKNIGPKLLNRLFGPPNGVTHQCLAVVSAGKEDGLKRPNRKVINALSRRGVASVSTAGGGFWYHFQAPVRPSYGAAFALPFENFVPSDFATS